MRYCDPEWRFHVFFRRSNFLLNPNTVDKKYIIVDRIWLFSKLYIEQIFYKKLLSEFDFFAISLLFVLKFIVTTAMIIKRCLR